MSVVCSNAVPYDVRGKAYKWSDSEICIGSFDPKEHPNRIAANYIRFNPTIDPAAAMQVLEKCLENVSTASIEMYQGVDESPEYNRVWCISLLKDSEVVIADTLPLAICLFAKKLFTK